MSTIAAIATPQAAGGIAVIRISGSDAFCIADRVFQGAGGKQAASMPGYTCCYGSIHQKDASLLDHGILTVFRAPHSYTGEDVAELSCHGGIYVTQQVLAAVLEAGAQPAEAGEFTKRAFLNGKVSLTQAEAVMDLIGASGQRELQFAQSVQDGALFRRVRRITDDLVHVLGDLAAWADYPEEDLPEVQPDHLEAGIQHILEELQATLDTYSYGKILREGVSAVIVGKPNVGKSTLFNLLSGCQRSIVTEIAGTTRDMVEERIRLGNVTLRLIDTAGLRETEDVIEQIGVSIAREQVQQADLILAVFDATRALDAEDLAMMEQIQGRTVLAIVNKTDGVPVLDTEKLEQTFDQVLYLSAKEGTGLESLRQAVETLFYTGSVTPEMGIVANERQRGCLLTAREQVLQALEALHAGEFLDGITVLLDEAAQALLTLTGERVSEAVVNDVFARFCVGK